MKEYENVKNNTELRSEYKEYTLGLAVFDHLPVLLFLMSGLVMYSMYSSPILLAGVLACFVGGSCKAAWKLIVVRQHRDLAILTRAFHILMPAGFVLMLLSVPAGGKAAFAGLWRSITMMPAALLFALGFALMCLMGYLGSHMDSSARSNWIEEIVNTLAQLAVLIGVIMVYFGTYYHADATALKALDGTDSVRVTEISQELGEVETAAANTNTEDAGGAPNANAADESAAETAAAEIDEVEGWLFDGPGTEAALVFYPGAKVEAAAYAPVMAAIAEGGVDCYLCKMPLNFALMGKETAEKIRAAEQTRAKEKACAAEQIRATEQTCATEQTRAKEKTRANYEAEESEQTDIATKGDTHADSEATSDAQTDNKTYSDERTSIEIHPDTKATANAYKKWYIGGHSLGGAVAAMAADDAEETAASDAADDTESEVTSDAADDTENAAASDLGNDTEAKEVTDNTGEATAWDGLILFAAYPTDELTTPVLSIYGSEDGVLNREKYDNASADGLWPSDFTEKVIEGGNHAQFGNYGAQKGDGIAQIKASKQQREAANAVISWIRQK